MSEFDPTDHFESDRLAKRNSLRERGIDPYPPSFEPDLSLAEFEDRFADHEDDELPDERIQLAGRIRRFNDLGSVVFFGIEDESGGGQLFIDEDTDGYDLVEDLHRGDIVGAVGAPMRTNRGELSLGVKDLHVVTKALNHPPSDGLNDEARVRNRPVAMWDADLHETLRTRFEVISATRSFLEAREFVEADTTVLQNVYGGANATPFETYCEAKDEQMYLRVATEIDLKKLVVGGFERVFEIGKVFRNEDIDTTHNPEFQMLELYQAWADYEDMMAITEALVCHLLDTVADGARRIEYNGETLDFSRPWDRVTMTDAIAAHSDLMVEDLSDEELRAEAEARGAEFPGGFERGLGIMELFEAVAESELNDPTFVIDHPQETTPLCKDHRSKEGRIERFELFVGGAELANSYTELNDPVQQGEHFAAQLERFEAGDDEAHQMDEAFLDALGYGMPPTGGLGIGIDRLVMLLTDSQSIKDVLPFPMVSTTN
ncbi:lysine--tRNA ligase [Halobaculum rubrum]|uniref:lysine--tRNA ligase n=1 Tax=Halobaculum rubrum TaxID=2872158 RepID=UPI001CA393CA|nr:lysine--tRNA ligase [Halobaculum rubrum]QZY01164.1 lysine--tRNA ligase [Halobaculum rubrum]